MSVARGQSQLEGPVDLAPVQPDTSLESVIFDLILKFLQTPGQVLLVQGPPGSGKTTFALDSQQPRGDPQDIRVEQSGPGQTPSAFSLDRRSHRHDVRQNSEGKLDRRASRSPPGRTGHYFQPSSQIETLEAKSGLGC